MCKYYKHPIKNAAKFHISIAHINTMGEIHLFINNKEFNENDSFEIIKEIK